MWTLQRVKSGIMAAKEGGADILSAATRARSSRSSTPDPGESLQHMTMRSNSDEQSRASGRRSGFVGSSRRSGLFSRKARGPTVAWFGAQLAVQPSDIDRGRTVPKILSALRRALEEQCGLEQEGIFRESADRRLVSFVRQRLEAGEDPDAVLEGCSSEVLGALIKLWFAELPGGVWVCEHDQGSAQRKGGNQRSKELEARVIHAARSGTSIIVRLQQAQREALLWLIELLRDAAGCAQASKMGVDNLAIVFAPTLLPWDSKATPTEQLQRAKDGVALVQALLRGQVVIADTEAEKYDTSVVEEESVLDADEEKTLVVNNLPTPDPEEETAFVAK